MVLLVVVAVVWSCAVAALVVLFMGRDRLRAEAAADRADVLAPTVPASRPHRPVVVARSDGAGTVRDAEEAQPAVSTAS